ncbi:MAG TPA: hypothetical protein VKP30_01745, partial [Polyangiaceae bacterium]|nr:hypothetical protein [Polyangiaceae bacterium]
IEKKSTPAPEPETLGSDRPEHERPAIAQRRLDRGVDVFARVGFERGSLPTDTGWLGIGFRLRASKLPLSFSLSTYATQETSATFTNGIGANFRLFAGQALICLQPNTHHWFIAGCGGAQLSVTRAAGFIHSVEGGSAGEYFVRYRWTPAPLFALALGYELLRPLTVEVGGGITLPLQRLAYVVENVGLLARSERQQMLLYAGIALAL